MVKIIIYQGKCLYNNEIVKGGFYTDGYHTYIISGTRYRPQKVTWDYLDYPGRQPIYKPLLIEVDPTTVYYQQINYDTETEKVSVIH